MKPATEILLSAAFVLTPKENRTTHARARTDDGDEVSPLNPHATCWCMFGAVQAVAAWPGYDSREVCHVMDAIAAVLGTPAIGSWHDTHTHAEVLDALYRAAELSEAA